jgi:hypothetical protein
VSGLVVLTRVAPEAPSLDVAQETVVTATPSQQASATNTNETAALTAFTEWAQTFRATE